ncbi:MAG TPA: hypothetical protein VG796_05730 [Verrucomicrobiales bacterium]|nr:hypothetical protein [Verrucomicrobiales bacterium]
MLLRSPIVVSLLLFVSVRSGAAGGGGKSSAKSVSPGQGSPGWQWSGSAGIGYRNLGGIDFNTGWNSSAALLPPLQSQTPGGRPSRIEDLTVGSETAFANRTYLDGFVNIDGSTENPNSFLPGTTAFWGYQSDAQVQDGNLRFNGGEYATSVSSADSSTQSGDWSSDMEGLTPVLELQALYSLSPELRAGGRLTFMFTKFDADNQATTFRSTQSLTGTVFTVTDLYNLRGVIPPAAPYAGTLNSSGTAPLIDNIPSQRIITAGTPVVQSAVYENSVEESVDLSLSTLSLGPTIEYARGDFSFSGSFGLALNFANWDASSQERLFQTAAGAPRTQVREWRDHRSGTDVLPGFFITAAGSRRLNDQWEVSLFGRYDWSKELSEGVGASRFSADPGGCSLGGTITFKF